MLHRLLGENYQQQPYLLGPLHATQLTRQARYTQCCNTRMTIVGSTNHFLIGFKASPTGGFGSGSVWESPRVNTLLLFDKGWGWIWWVFIYTVGMDKIVKAYI